jgi:hypothetical protein
MTERNPRAKETREEDTRAHEVRAYVPPSVLPDVTPPPGVVTRWVRTALAGEADPTNTSQRIREGWVIATPDQFPELKMLSEIEGQITMGGLTLCVCDKDRMDARRKYFDDKAKLQEASVDANYMREGDPRMPLLPTESKSRVSFGGGSS